MTFEPPQYLFVTLLGLGLTIAVILTYHELRKQKDRKEWEYIRTHKVEQAKQYTSGLYDTLQAMREELRSLVNKVQLMPVNQDILDKIHPYMYKEYPNFYMSGVRSDEEQLKFFIDFAALMNSLGIGLQKALTDDSWSQLEKNLERYIKADQLLGELIKELKITLVGAQSYRLYNHYTRMNAVTPQSHEEIYTVVRSHTSDQAMEVFLDRALTKVSKRINELLRGD